MSRCEEFVGMRYKNDPKLRREDVEIFRQWLSKQLHMPQLNETQLILFLQGCSYSIEAAKVTIDAYFTRRTLFPQLFNCPSEDVLRKGFSVTANLVIPRKTPQGCDIFMTHLLDSRPENFDFILEVILISTVASQYVYDIGSLGGFVAVLDFKGTTLSHLTRVNLTALKTYLDHLQEGIPVRIKGIHIINAVPFMDKVLALAKPFLHNQLFNLIQIHSSFDTFYKCLPKDYDGDLPAIQMLHEETVERVINGLDFFKWHDSQTVDESKRMEKSKLVGSSFGVDGTFKKMEID